VLAMPGCFISSFEFKLAISKGNRQRRAYNR
jgi:hypothetical protein